MSHYGFNNEYITLNQLSVLTVTDRKPSNMELCCKPAAISYRYRKKQVLQKVSEQMKVIRDSNVDTGSLGHGICYKPAAFIFKYGETSIFRKIVIK